VVVRSAVTGPDSSRGFNVPTHPSDYAADKHNIPHWITL